MIGFRGVRGRLGLPVVLAGTLALGMATPTVAVAAVVAAVMKPPTPSPGPAVKGVVDAKPHFVSPPDETRRGYVATATPWPVAASTSCGPPAPAPPPPARAPRAAL